MTSNTSWFNRGIFLNSLKRFKWGSVLYFIALFFSVPFSILVDNIDSLTRRYIGTDVYRVPLLLSDNYLVVPLLFAMVVPTVVAVLVFHNVHSPKQSIFEHGLPVTRRENYISNVAAGLALMFLPVLANGIILMIMSLSAYSQLIATANVLYWIALNCAVIFIMFSVASATGFLTGHAAAHIGINIFIHVLPMLIALTIALISDVFLFGFMQTDSFIATEIMQYTPIVWLFAEPLSSYRELVNVFAEPAMWFYIVGAVIIYVAGYALYGRRKIELSGDVAAFKAFRPIFKYTITAAVTVVLFAITNPMNMHTVYKIIVALVGAAIAYFACEMLINKTLKVFKNYGGFCIFGLCTALFIAFFAYTSVFGYETRVPDLADVESAAIYTNRAYGDRLPLIADSEVIKATQEIHREVIKDIPVTCDSGERVFNITYKLRNGREISRRYWVTTDVYDRAFMAMYDNVEYKLKITGLDNINIEHVRDLRLEFNSSYYHDSFNVSKKGDRVAVINRAPDIMAAVKKDVEALSYEEIELGDNWADFNISFDCTAKDNEAYKIFKEIQIGEFHDYDHVVESFHMSINSNFENTYNLLKELGIYQARQSELADRLYLLRLPVTSDKLGYTYKGQTGEEHEFSVSKADCVKLDMGIGQAVAEEIMTEKRQSIPLDSTVYFVYAAEKDTHDTFHMTSFAICYTEENLPEYLEKFVIK